MFSIDCEWDSNPCSGGSHSCCVVLPHLKVYARNLLEGLLEPIFKSCSSENKSRPVLSLGSLTKKDQDIQQSGEGKKEVLVTKCHLTSTVAAAHWGREEGRTKTGERDGWKDRVFSELKDAHKRSGEHFGALEELVFGGGVLSPGDSSFEVLRFSLHCSSLACIILLADWSRKGSDWWES